MPTVRPSVVFALAAVSILSAGYSTAATRDGAAVPERPRRPQVVDAEGVVPDYCPKVALREGTSVLRKGSPEPQYIASITQTTRECHVVDGELRIKVGASGRVLAGPAGRGATVALPIRIAVVSGADVLYANKGTQSVAFAQGAPGRFVYVDEMVRVPEPQSRNYTIFVGFDEGK